MRKVAVTGGLSSGKSTVCRVFQDLGAYTVSADAIVHKLLSSDKKLCQQIVDLFGPEILTNNHLDRDKIAKKVFSDPKKLQSLETLIHPAVFHEIQTEYSQIKDNTNYNLFVAEVPLLYETESQNMFDAVITVLADEKTCKQRFSTMKNQSEIEFDHRMLRQISPQEKAVKADYIILNNGSFEELQTQVVKLSTKLRSI